MLQPRPIDALAQRREAARSMYLKCAADLAYFADLEDLFAIDDLVAEMDELLDEWCAAASFARPTRTPAEGTDDDHKI